MKRLYILISLLFLIFSCVKNNNVNTSIFTIYNNETENGNSLNIYANDDIFSVSDNPQFYFQVQCNTGYSLELPDLRVLEESLNVLDFKKNDGDLYILILDNLLPGEYSIEPMQFIFKGTGLEEEILESGQITFEVTSSLIDGEEDILDDFSEIKKQFSWRYIILIIILCILVAVFFVFIFQKKDKDKCQTETYSRAQFFEELNSLDTDDVSFFYKSLSDLLKAFLDSTIFLSVQSQTTEEFISAVKDSKILDDSMKMKLFDFFTRSDMIVFGQDQNLKTLIEDDINFVKVFMQYIENQIKEEN